MKRARYIDYVCISLLVVCQILLSVPRLRGPIDLRYDAGVYYILGTSLAEGKGYRLLNEPGAIQEIQYPPLLPLFVAVHQRLAGRSDPLVVGRMLRISFFALLLAFIVAAYLLSRHFLPPVPAYLATVPMLLHVETMWSSEILYAELPFALGSVLFLLAARHAKGKSREWLAGGLAVTCFLLRSVGIALLAAWLGDALLERRYRVMAVRAVVTLVAVLAWQAYVGSVKHAPEYQQPAYEYQRADYQSYNVTYADNLVYVDPFTPELGKESIPNLARRMVWNLVRLPQTLGSAVSVRRDRGTYAARRIKQKFGIGWLPESAIDVVPFFVLGSMVLFGLAVLALRGERLLLVYVLASGFLISVTPLPEQLGRYLWPLSPVLFIALVAGLAVTQHRLSVIVKGKLRIPVMAMIALTALALLTIQGYARYKFPTDKAFYQDGTGKRQQYDLLYFTPAWKHHEEALDWLGRHADTHDIVATTTPHWLYIKTGLSAVMPPFEPDLIEAQRLLDSVPVTYLITDSLHFLSADLLDFSDVNRRYAAPVVDAFPARWELIYTSADNDSRIYRRTNQDKGLDKRETSRAELR